MNETTCVVKAASDKIDGVDDVDLRPVHGRSRAERVAVGEKQQGHDECRQRGTECIHQRVLKERSARAQLARAQHDRAGEREEASEKVEGRMSVVVVVGDAVVVDH